MRVGEHLFDRVKNSLTSLGTPLSSFNKINFGLIIPSNNSLSAQTVNRLSSWLDEERKKNPTFFQGIYDSGIDYHALAEMDPYEIYHGLPEGEKDMVQFFLDSDKPGKLKHVNRNILARALHEKDREKYARAQKFSNERMRKLDSFVFKVNDAGGALADKRLLGKVPKNPKTLFIKIHDEAHHAATPEGVANHIVNHGLQSSNVICVSVSATPYNLQTQESQIPVDNEIHWCADANAANK